jgi:hypothetical protein
MSTTTEAGITTERLSEISTLVKRAGEEAVQLRIVERFLSEVERRLLKTTPSIFDIQRIRTALQILKTLSADDDIDECLEAEFRLDQEFHLWRELIIERDHKIETYHFRRLCDSAPYPLEDEIFIALASFYRSLDLTPATQSKFDLSVTRLFTRSIAGGSREMRAVRSDNVKRLKNLFPRIENDTLSPDKIDYAVAAIEGFIDEALDFKVFEDLVKANIFDRYRVFKRELGHLFFEPEVVAAAIECNIAVGNVFDNLLRSADEQLSSLLTVDVDIAGALHDPAPETRSHINELFRVFFGENEPNDQPVSGDVDYLGKLLSASSNKSTAAVRSDLPHSESSSAQGRLAPFLRTLTEARPDSELLLKQMRRSESLRSFDINDFLYNSDGNPDVLCRRALGLILWSLEFRENELKQSKELTESIQREATSLLYKAEHLATKLQHDVEVSDELNESRLRGVLNALMDSRLRLERGIVRFTNRKIAEVTEAVQTQNVRQAPSAKRHRSIGGIFVRWLIITLLIVAATATVFSLMQQQFAGFMGTGSNLSSIDPRTLPQNEFIKSAYRVDQTLFITARDTWAQRTPEERQQTINAILEKPGFKYRTVVVMSENGAVLDNISRDGIVSVSGSSQTSSEARPNQ